MSYWFQQPMTARGWVMWFWALMFLALILAGLLAKIVRQIKKDNELKEVLRRLGDLWLAAGLLGLLWMFFRQERIAFFAWRFWLLFWLLLFVSWHLKIIKYIIKRLPEIKREKWEREMRQKYLPGKK